MRKIIFIICILFIILQINGCAHKNLKMSTRIYPDRNIQEVLLAAERVFRLADDSYILSYKSGILQAQRKSIQHSCLGHPPFAIFEEYWIVSAQTLKKGGVKVEVTQLGKYDIAMDPSLKDFTLHYDSLHNMNLKPSIYKFFFSRIEYLMGLNDNWNKCVQRKYHLFTEEFYSNPLCFATKDRLPE